jgi:hypothetical protein
VFTADSWPIGWCALGALSSSFKHLRRGDSGEAHAVDASACHGSTCSRSVQWQQIACRRRGGQSGFEGLQGRIRVDETSGTRPDSCSSRS